MNGNYVTRSRERRLDDLELTIAAKKAEIKSLQDQVDFLTDEWETLKATWRNNQPVFDYIPLNNGETHIVARTQ